MPLYPCILMFRSGHDKKILVNIYVQHIYAWDGALSHMEQNLANIV